MMNSKRRIANCRLIIFLIFILWFFSLNAQDSGIATIDWLPNSKRIEAGSLTVPENHDEPDGRKIEISYIVIKAKEPDSNRFPIIFFSGGPGGNTLDPGMVNFMLEHPLTVQRDLILFDQRGIGYSSPMPDMGFESFGILAKDADEAQELELTKKMIDRYREQCIEQDIHPEYYNTQENAKDVGMLFKHLRYEKYILFGGSYGTRLARVVQDYFPEYVYASVLDSPSPLNTDFLLQRLESYELALSRIFEYCENSETCHDQYPQLEDDYFQAIASLQEKPLKVNLGDTLDFYINAQDGIYLLRRLLYQDDSRETAPAMIQALKSGKGEIINRVLSIEYELTGALNLTMLLSVEKFENFNPAIKDGDIDQVYQQQELIPVRLGFFDAFYRAGMNWHEGNLPMKDRTFSPSEVPSLIFVNRFDPVTPPRYGNLFMQDLSKGYLFVLDEGGHGGGNQECKTEVILNFMEDPYQAPDDGCLNIYERK